MKVSKKELIEMDACEEILERFIEQSGNTDDPVEVLSLMGGKNTLYDLLWLADKKLTKCRLARFVCDVALINMELIKPYTDDYDLIVNFLNSPNKDDASSVVAAIYADIYDDVDDDVEDAVYAVRYAVNAVVAVDYAISANPNRKDNVHELLKELFS